ncbi:hypothetical protein F6Y05_35685 [Bacillus megaterium]|nr:hypothetical protein [Priestia megaterium]
MKRYLELGKYLIKSFAKEKAGSAILEIVIILAIFGVSAAVITPIVRTQLAETYDSESKDITFGGERKCCDHSNTANKFFNRCRYIAFYNSSNGKVI